MVYWEMQRITMVWSKGNGWHRKWEIGYGVGNLLYITYPATDGKLGNHKERQSRQGKLEGVLSNEWCNVCWKGRNFLLENHSED